jgi:hypothetical protein
MLIYYVFPVTTWHAGYYVFPLTTWHAGYYVFPLTTWHSGYYLFLRLFTIVSIAGGLQPEPEPGGKCFQWTGWMMMG